MSVKGSPENVYLTLPSLSGKPQVLHQCEVNLVSMFATFNIPGSDSILLQNRRHRVNLRIELEKLAETCLLVYFMLL